MSDAQLELAEAAAYERTAIAMSDPYLRIGAAVCVATPWAAESTMLNRVTGLAIAEPATDRVLEEVDAFFRRYGVTYAVALSPFAEPDLGERLRERGFTDGYAWAKFRRGDEEPPEVETELRIEEAGPADGAAFAAVLAEAFGLTGGEAIAALPGAPGVHCYLAWADGEPAGAGAVVVEGDHAWLSFAGTVPEHRRKGAQNAIMAARIRKARELGCTTLMTETGALEEGRPSNSYRNILRAGFELRYVRPNLVSPS